MEDATDKASILDNSNTIVSCCFHIIPTDPLPGNLATTVYGVSLEVGKYLAEDIEWEIEDVECPGALVRQIHGFRAQVVGVNGVSFTAKKQDQKTPEVIQHMLFTE